MVIMAANITSAREWFIIVAGALLRSIWLHARQSLFPSWLFHQQTLSMTKVVKEAAIMELYNASIAALDEMYFGDSALLCFRGRFERKIEC
jgi:hypothetical protein